MRTTPLRLPPSFATAACRTSRSGLSEVAQGQGAFHGFPHLSLLFARACRAQDPERRFVEIVHDLLDGQKPHRRILVREAQARHRGAQREPQLVIDDDLLEPVLGRRDRHLTRKRIDKLERPALLFHDEEPPVLDTGVQVAMEQGTQHREALWMAQALDRLDGLGLLHEARLIEHLQGGCEWIGGCRLGDRRCKQRRDQEKQHRVQQGEAPAVPGAGCDA